MTASGQYGSITPYRSPNQDIGLVRPVLVAGTLFSLLVLLMLAPRVQEAEAGLSAQVAKVIGLPEAHLAGNAVIFQAGNQIAGYQITLGCSVALLVMPFFAATAGLLAIRRVNPVRAFSSLAAALLLIITFNQLRLLAIGLGMKLWGPALGYSRTHVFVGTLISTFGVIGAGAAYLNILVRGDRADRELARARQEAFHG